MDEVNVNTAQKSKPADREEIVIAIKALKKSFGEKYVLKDINLEVKKGENVVFL